MANVFFKTGKQDNYAALTTKDAGTFYVTSDTHRLYLGDNLLSQAVEVVASISALPGASDPRRAEGQFYYAKAENILCTWNPTGGTDGKGAWVQINPDTDTDTKVSGEAFTIATTDGVAKITNTINLVQKDDKTSAGSKTGDFSITGATGVAVSSSGTTVTVTGSTYDLSAGTNGGTTSGNEGYKISLTGSGTDSGDQGSAAITGGTNVQVSSSGVISATDTITSLSELNITNNGTTGYTIEVKAEDQNKTSRGAVSKNFDPIVRYGSKVSGNYPASAHFNGGYADLDVYTTSQVDTKLNAVDAMHYVGAISAMPETKGSTYHIGDTYKVAATITSGSTTYNINDLLIANGTEDESGYITSTSLTWDHIPAGAAAENVLHYVGYASAIKDGDNVTGAKLEFKEKTGSTLGSTTATLEIDNGNLIEVSEVDEDSTTSYAGVQSFKINHKAITADTTTGSTADVAALNSSSSTAEFEAITAVEQDGYGHVKSLTKHKFTVSDTKLTTTGSSATVTATANEGKTSATIQDAIVVKDTSGAQISLTPSFSIGSSTLEVTTSGTAVAMNLVWGSF